MKLPLSKIQEQFWVLGQLYPDTPTYNIPLVYKLNSELNTEAFKKSVLRTFSRHSILAANFEVENNIPYLVLPILPDISNFFEEITVQDFSSNSSDIILDEVQKPFNLTRGHLSRIRHIRFIDCTYLVFVFHHIIIDHHSKTVILADISKYYSMLINNQAIDTYDPVNEYKEFVLWEKQWLLTEKASKIRKEWTNIFTNNRDQISLPYDFNSDQAFKSKGKRFQFNLEHDISVRIKNYAEANNITPFVFLSSAFAMFLARIEEQSVFSIGMPLSNRRQEQFKDTVGCFVNILPHFVNVSSKPKFSEITKQVRKELLTNHRRQEIPFIELQAIYNETGKGHPFQVGFTFEEPVELHLENQQIEWQTIERKGSQLEMFLTLWDSEFGFQGFWEFDTDKFEQKTIIHLIEIYKTLIKEVLINKDQRYTEYNILPSSDSLIIKTINNTQCPFSDNMCIHQIFERKVTEDPNNIALVYEDRKVTYDELNKLTNRLAHFLLRRNLHVGDIVGVACERRIEMLIAILAILKTGAVYLPFNLDSPKEIKQEIIDHANPKYILASDVGRKNIADKEKIISIENILDEHVSDDDDNPNIHIKPECLAYIIFTSGSTGTPKGVKIKHSSVINRLEWMQKTYELNSSDVLFQKTPVTFDVSIWELFWWFFGGAQLALPKQNLEKDPLQIIDFISKHKVTKIHFVPSMFVYFIEALQKFNLTSKIKTLKTIFCSGESLHTEMVKDFYGLNFTATLPQIVNLYGPTEATVDVSYYNCPKNIDNVFIGRPIDNTGLFVVNSDLKIQPIGIKGELIITGVNLADGYLDDSNLTNQKFVPFVDSNGNTVLAYKTGDIVKWNEIGELEFIGRKDNQVKVRGIRVELGEIEARVSKHPKISSVAVKTIDDKKNSQIIAFIELKEANSTSKRQLISDFRQLLSPHMLPSDVIFVDRLPLTSSGKIDRKQLLKPQKSNALNLPSRSQQSFYENELIRIWQQVLNNENIQITDNFYDAGGNSLLAIKLSMQIAAKFSIEPDVISIMEYPKIKDYAVFIENKIESIPKAENVQHEEFTSRHETMRLRFSNLRGK